MTKFIGAASDFWRLRLAALDSTDEPDLEWRDDILYRTPPAPQVVERQMWVVEAVSLDDEDLVRVIGRFESAEDAHALLARAEEDLLEITVSEFDERYLCGGSAD